MTAPTHTVAAAAAQSKLMTLKMLKGAYSHASTLCNETTSAEKLKTLKPLAAKATKSGAVASARCRHVCQSHAATSRVQMISTTSKLTCRSWRVLYRAICRSNSPPASCKWCRSPNKTSEKQANCSHATPRHARRPCAAVLAQTTVEIAKTARPPSCTALLEKPNVLTPAFSFCVALMSIERQALTQAS